MAGPVTELKQDGTTIDLLDDTGWKREISPKKWVRKIALATSGRRPPPVFETIPIVSFHANENALSAAEIALNDLGTVQASYQRDITEKDATWLHDQLTNETGERRAYVRGVSLNPTGPIVDPSTECTYQGYDLVVERHGLWERPTGRPMPQASPAAAVSVIYDYTAAGAVVAAHDIVGDAPARLALFEIEPAADTDELGRVWCGIRTARKHGNVGNFVNIWELETAGAVLGTDAARAADATASPGGGGNTKVTVTPGTTGWAKRLTITLGDVTSNWTDNEGNMLWLLRAKAVNGGTGGTWDIQLRFGYTAMADDDFIEGPIKPFSNTSWDFVEMDEQRIPLHNLQAFPSTVLSSEGVRGFTIQVWARRTAGSAGDNLDLDCLCPVPIDAAWLKCKDFAAVAAVGAPSDFWVYGDSPKYQRQAWVYQIDNVTAELTAQEVTTLSRDDTGMGLPPGDGRMIIVYARETSSDITDLIIINAADVGLYYECWRGLRGAE